MERQQGNIFFMGVAGTGMSALAQYLSEEGHRVSGSDRLFREGEANETRTKLEAAGILCYPQDGSGMIPLPSLVVVSTAVEDSVAEVKLALENGIPVIRRSELLARLVSERKTIAVAGTSGKSTTVAMIYHILDRAGLSPGIISGAGLSALIREGRIGNANHGSGEWLVVEADESDGSIVQYKPEIGILLNIDKDHQELPILVDLFQQFRQHCRQFSVNRSHPLAASLSVEPRLDFASSPGTGAGMEAKDFHQDGMQIRFSIGQHACALHAIGRHSMENATAAIAAAAMAGVDPGFAATALESYEGIHRRHQYMGSVGNTIIIDDYAHNPAKCAASIRACQPLAPKVLAWFQPHGYGPTKFLRQEFVEEIAGALRPEDEIWMSEIYYAGGTAVKDISAADLIDDLKKKMVRAVFIADRNDLASAIRKELQGSSVLLLMGARDPSLETFAHGLVDQLRRDGEA